MYVLISENECSLYFTYYMRLLEVD